MTIVDVEKARLKQLEAEIINTQARTAEVRAQATEVQVRAIKQLITIPAFSIISILRAVVHDDLSLLEEDVRTVLIP